MKLCFTSILTSRKSLIIIIIRKISFIVTSQFHLILHLFYCRRNYGVFLIEIFRD